MGTIRFGNDGYDFFDKGRMVLFEENKNRHLLLDYYTKDLSRLPMLLERYVSKIMDTTTFMLTGYQPSMNDCAEMIMFLKFLHPYYEHEYRRVITKAIGDYFNALLVHSCCGLIKITWYYERFNVLAAPFLHDSEIFNTDELNKIMDYIIILKNKEYFLNHTNLLPPPLNSYEKYLKLIGKDVPEDIEEGFKPPKPEIKGFSHELSTQEYVRSILFRILDIESPGIDKLTIPQRAWIYKNIFNLFQYETTVTQKLSLDAMPLFRPNVDRSHEMEYAQKLNDLFIPLRTLLKSSNYHESASPDVMAALSCVTKEAKKVTDVRIHEEYEIDDLRQLLVLEMLMMIQTNTFIKRCKHCELYFVVINRKIAYCNRVIEDEEGETCFTVGAQRSFQKKLDTDYPLQIYKRAYKTHFARTKSKNMRHFDFGAWSKEAKNKLDKIRNAKPDDSDVTAYEEWLNDVVAYEKWLKE